MKKYPGQFFTILFFFVLFVIGPAAAGCAGTDDYDVKIETIDGVKVVANPAYPRDGKVKLKLKHELTIGDDEEAEVLIYHPLNVQADKTGNIYIWEYTLSCLKVFDRQGRFLRQIGRRGQGPGEFSANTRFTLLNENKIYLIDANKRRITIFSTKGEFIKDFRYDSQWFCPHLRSDGKSQLYTFRSVTSFEGKLKSNYQAFESEKHLYRFDTITNEWHLLSVFGGEQRVLRGFGENGAEGFSTPFSIVWNVDSRGNIITGLNKTYSLDVYSSQGKLMFKFSRDVEPKKNKDAKKLRKLFGSISKVFEFLPAFGSKILLDEQGRIWVEQHKQDDRYKNVAYDIFSKDGIYMKRVVFPYRIYQFKNNKVYGIAVSKNDERVIKRTAILSGLD